ncbi:MAG: hypothetical protein JW946_04935 [Candidatus Omnitrophica bacterium]|nr:hypothetical protein [Candidatus Omnitrophota bacterium]
MSLDKQEYKKGETIAAEFKLKNTGKQQVYINKRFFIPGEISLSVIAPSGDSLPCKVSYEPGLPKTDYFALLLPGEEIAAERKISINYYFDFNEPGVYKIAASYQNKYGSELGIDAFKDKVASKPVTIKIMQ